MAISERTKRNIEKLLNFGQDPRQEMGERETGFRHSTYYHKHFQGYTEIRSVRPNGSIAIERRYTAPWIQHQLNTKRWVLTKIAYVLSVLLSSFLYLWALVQRIPGNSAAIVAAAGMPTGILLVLMWMAVCAYVTAPRNMTQWEYHSGKKKVELFSRVSAAGVVLTALMKVVFCICFGGSWSAEWSSILALLMAAAPLLAMYFTEYKMQYQEIENNTLVNEEERYRIL